MNQRTELLSLSYKPELSIVVYRSSASENGNSYGHYHDSYYLESHEINDKGEVMAGKPLLEETLNGLVSALKKDQKDRSSVFGMIPENLLFYKPIPGGAFNLLWYRPAEIRFFHFAPQLKLKSGRMWVPAVLYSVDGTSGLSVFAMKKDGRPTEKTLLMRAPFHNVADEGKVCLGNANVKKPSDKGFISTMKYWEDLFWLSEFAHLNGLVNPTRSPLEIVYKKLLASKEKIKWSDLKELKPSRKQIKSLLQ